MIALALLALATAMALLTWIIGWWAVPLVAFIAGAAWHRERGRAAAVALAAALAWAALLALDASDGRLGVLGTLLGGVFPVPGVVLMAVTLLFAALAAWSAAVVGAAVRAMVARNAP